MSRNEWDLVKTSGTRLSVALYVNEYLQERTESLNIRLKWFSNNINKLDDIAIENSRINIDRLEKNTPTEDILLSQNLYQMMPNIKLLDLLSEVSKWTGFNRQCKF